MGASSINVATRLYKPVVHRVDISFAGIREDAETIAKAFNITETKEKSGEKYKVTVYKEAKGESIAVYEYKEKTIIRVNTHRLQRRQHVVDYIAKFGLQVLRDYMELYYRISSRYETIVNTAVLAYSEVRGLGYFSQTVTRGWERLVYNTRTDKHTISQDLYAVLKLYRDKELKEDPKLEVEFWARRLLTPADINLAGGILNTIVKLTKARLVFNEYDKHQDTITIEGYDRALHRALFATTKRLAISILLNKNYRDKRLAIAELLDKGLRPADIARLMGYTRVRVHQIIQELIDLGLIVREKRGKYKLLSKAVKVEHPLPMHMIVNLEYEKIRVTTVPAPAWNKNTLITKYTSEGWRLHPEYRQGYDGVIVFYKPGSSEYEYLLVKRSSSPSPTAIAYTVKYSTTTYI